MKFPTKQLSIAQVITTTALTVLIAGGCTTTPDKYKNNSSSQAVASPLQANNSKMQSVATADVGVAQRFVDRQSGMTSELIVDSEYFSANGRTCRRFTERLNGQSRTGVGCQDSRNGWVELPLDKFLR